MKHRWKLTRERGLGGEHSCTKCGMRRRKYLVLDARCRHQIWRVEYQWHEGDWFVSDATPVCIGPTVVEPAAPSATETECSPCIGTGRAGGGYYHGAHEHGAAGDEVCGPCGGSGVTQAVRA